MADGAGGAEPEDKFVKLMRRTMDRFGAAWERGDIEALMDLLGPDPTYHTSSGALFSGRPAVREGFQMMCRPASGGNAAPAAENRMHFFDQYCLSYWTLPISTADGGQTIVRGIDIITFDRQARVISKDAYRKLA